MREKNGKKEMTNKPPSSFRLGRLTPSEIESLRQDKRRVSEVAGAWLRKNRPDLIRAKR